MKKFLPDGYEEILHRCKHHQEISNFLKEHQGSECSDALLSELMKALVPWLLSDAGGRLGEGTMDTTEFAKIFVGVLKKHPTL